MYVSLAESDFFFTRLRYIVFEKYFLEFKFQGIESLILKFKDNFVKSDGKIGITDLVTHTYRRDTIPVFVYRLMTHYIVQMLQNNVTEPSNSGRYWCWWWLTQSLVWNIFVLSVKFNFVFGNKFEIFFGKRFG